MGNGHPAAAQLGEGLGRLWEEKAFPKLNLSHPQKPRAPLPLLVPCLLRGLPRAHEMPATSGGRPRAPCTAIAAHTVQRPMGTTPEGQVCDGRSKPLSPSLGEARVCLLNFFASSRLQEMAVFLRHIQQTGWGPMELDRTSHYIFIL